MRSTTLAAVLIVALTTAACSSNANTTASTESTSTAATDAAIASEISVATNIDGVKTFGPLLQEHVDTPVSYPQSPPVGGSHDPKWQNCGVYDTPVKNENAVHSMEHGAVWLTYRPDLPADQVAIVRAFARNHTHVLVSPYEGLTEAVVANAWGKQLRLDSVTDARLAAFVVEYEQGPQTPELGVTCGGAIGAPIE